MMNTPKNAQNQYEQYLHIFNVLNDAIKWKVERRNIMLISFIFTQNESPLDVDLFLSISDHIKKEAGFFSPLRSYYRYIIAATLMVKSKDPKGYFKTFNKIYQTLVKSGFKRNTHTIISALSYVMELDGAEFAPEVLKIRAKKTLSIYKGMRKEHFILTASSDYPVAFLLSKLDRDVKDLILDMEYYYSSLSNGQFKKGNDLQFLSHMLLLNDKPAQDERVKNCNDTYAMISNKGINFKQIHYASIGLLSMLKENEQLIDDVILLQNQLNSDKKLRQYKDLNFIVAASLLIKDHIRDSSLHTTSMTTTLEIIIQAQIATSVASMAATSAAASSAAT